MKKQVPLISIAVIVLIILFTGIYWLSKKIVRDRASAMNFEPVVRRQIQPSTGPKTTTRTYTQNDLEEARKQGKPLPGMNQPYIPPSQTSEAAVQRSMKTLEEVNRINEMNRRLMEQQQRQQKQ